MKLQHHDANEQRLSKTLRHRGADLTSFSVEDRLAWAKGRQIKQEEDVVYSLLGVLGVVIVPIYGEGYKHALRRLRRETRQAQGVESNDTLDRERAPQSLENDPRPTERPSTAL